MSRAINPLEPIHAIQKAIYPALEIAQALRFLGIPAGDDLQEILEHIHGLAKEASGAVCAEESARYQETQQQTGRILGALLEASLAGGQP